MIKTISDRLILLFLLSTPCVVVAKNMNEGVYTIANSADFDTQYKTEYFDVYSPLISSYYSQVYWAGMEPVALPKEIIERFNNKTMALVGYEVNQVKKVEGQEDMPVPITHAYNHHYIASMYDHRKGYMAQRPATHQDRQRGMTHGHDVVYQFEHFDNATVADELKGYDLPDLAAAQIFSEANGGEFRLSFHGYPPGFAQLIRSPTRFAVNPMQIDTWNRDHGASSKFALGPLPKISPVYNDPTAIYSGLLECPCCDRIEKKWWYQYTLEKSHGDDNKCDAIANSTECWTGGQSVVPASQVKTRVVHSDSTRPAGCSVVQQHDGVLDIVWNELSDETLWDDEDEKPTEIMAFAAGVINATISLQTQTADHEDENDGASAKSAATITLVGPSDKWFGIGFGSHNMCRHLEADECLDGGPYAILAYDTHVEERYLDYHGKGKVLPSTLQVQSNTVEGSYRTVVLTRPLHGPDERYFSFDASDTDKALPIIMATGCNMTLAQHCGHGTADLTFLPVDTPRRVCRHGKQATIAGKYFSMNRCLPFPYSTLLDQQNPTCFLETYQGGLSCCQHLQPLLDKDQEIPWKDQLLEYHMKFRFYFEEYTPAKKAVLPDVNVNGASTFTTTPASHEALVRFYWQTEANAGEYDIVACPKGTPPSQCVQVITSQWKVREMLNPCTGEWCTGPDSPKADGIELVYAGPHCHAPSCLSMELYNADTGQLLCHVEPSAGSGSDEANDELGYLAIPPCLWGRDGSVMPPEFLSLNTTLLSIKRNNNTRSHFGEMASWQMRGVMIYNKTQVDKERAEAFNHKIKQDDALLVADEALVKSSIRKKGRPEV